MQRENSKAQAHFSERLEGFKRSVGRFSRKGSRRYRREMKRAETAQKHGLGFASGFMPVTIKSKHWFAIKLGGRGENFGIRLMTGKLNGEKMLFITGLSFKPGTVVIDVLQGTKGESKLIQEFQTAVGKHHADFIVSEIERQGKKLGYSQVELTLPENLEYYQTPYTDTVHPDGTVTTHQLNPANPKEKAEIERIRTNIKKLYHGVVTNRKFVRQKNAFVKTL